MLILRDSFLRSANFTCFSLSLMLLWVKMFNSLAPLREIVVCRCTAAFSVSERVSCRRRRFCFLNRFPAGKGNSAGQKEPADGFRDNRAEKGELLRGNKGMKKNVRAFLMLTAAIMTAALAAGCGQMRDGNGPMQIKETEKVTDAPIVVVTEAVTEAPETEKETQPVTELPPQTETQPVTEAPAPAPEPATEVELSAKEERNQEQDYENWTTMYALDDVNVREKPTTKKDNVFRSLDQGQTVTVTGETPNWYKVYFEDSDSYGYVSKDWLSASEVAPKTDEERAAAASQAAETAPAAEPVQAEHMDEDDNTAAPAPQPAAAPAVEVSGGTVVTLNSDANLRSAASEVSDVVGVLNAGTQVTIVGEADRWYQVNYNGSSGYINKNLVG
jgi:uncharacterized protein YgiM (DUF1202 family)